MNLEIPCICRRCGEPAVGKDDADRDLCFDHLTDWQVEQEGFYRGAEQDEREAFLRLARAL